MIVHLAQLNFWVLTPVAFGILTIFGRKGKKEDKEEEEKQEPAIVQKPVEQTPRPTPSPQKPLTSSPATSDYNFAEPPTTPEESSLNKLLQSLLHDVPLTPPPEGESSYLGPTSTPDWVPPRTTPPSRPMVIVPGEKGEKVLAPAEPEPPSPAKVAKPPETTPTPAIQTSKPSPPPAPPPQVQAVPKADEEAKKPTKPERLERPEAKQAAETLSKSAQSFDHIFDLTQGSLRAPGLIIINGPSDSGKTTLSSNLAGAFLKTGTPCILVSYDQSVATLRDLSKQTGWDAPQYESQFRLLIIDGYSAQSDSFSFEPYSVEKPFDMDSLSDTLLRNSQMFMGSNVQVILDSLTAVASKTPTKEFLSKFKDLSGQMKEVGATLVVTVDETKLSKDVTGPLEDLAVCVIDLQRDAKGNGQLKVRKSNGSVSRSQAEDFDIEPGKGLVFA